MAPTLRGHGGGRRANQPVLKPLARAPIGAMGQLTGCARTACGAAPHRQLWRFGHVLQVIWSGPVDPMKMICDDAGCEGDEPARGDAVALTGTSAGSQDARLRRGRARPACSRDTGLSSSEDRSGLAGPVFLLLLLSPILLRAQHRHDFEIGEVRPTGGPSL